MSAPAPDGARVLLHVPTSTYLRLDRSAARIVDLVAAEGVDGAASALSRRYDVPLDRARTDVDLVVGSVRGLSATPQTSSRPPTLRGTLAVLRGWWRLSPPARWAAAKAIVVVVLAELGLHTVDLGRLSWLMRVPLATGTTGAAPLTVPADGSPGDLERLSEGERRAYWAVGWVLRRWTYDATCLREALALGFFLRHQHPVLRLGLIEHGALAHAWVDVGGAAYNAMPVVGTFTSAPPAGAPGGVPPVGGERLPPAHR